jgi:hypothetical protein
MRGATIMRMITKKRVEQVLNVKLRYLGHGFDRIGYRYKGIVFKLPKNERGQDCNQFEVDNWKAAKSELITTRKLVIDGVTIAMQPYLELPEGYERPDWSDWYDCAQGGLNHKGEFKIYDFPPNWMGNSAAVMW